MTGSNTAKKQRKSRSLGKPFVKGDPRINRKGRPRTFDQVRKLAIELAHTEISKGKMAGQTVVTGILAQWAASREPTLQKEFMYYAFGKVPDKVETNALDGVTIIEVKHAHELDAVSPSRNGHASEVTPGTDPDR